MDERLCLRLINAKTNESCLFDCGCFCRLIEWQTAATLVSDGEIEESASENGGLQGVSSGELANLLRKLEGEVVVVVAAVVAAVLDPNGIVVAAVEAGGIEATEGVQLLCPAVQLQTEMLCG